MAGTIRKINPAALQSAEDISSFISDSGPLSESSVSDDREDLSPCMEFDLRESSEQQKPESFLCDAPTVSSEGVIILEDLPSLQPIRRPKEDIDIDPGSSLQSQCVIASQAAAPLMTERERVEEPAVATPKPVPRSHIAQRNSSNLSKLVDELLDSPALMQLDGSAHPLKLISSHPRAADRGAGTPVFPIHRGSSSRSIAGVVPLAVQNRGRLPSPSVRRPDPPPKPRDLYLHEDWVCPDSWIPNHKCDSFCWDSLRSC